MTRNYFKIFSSIVITFTIIFAQFLPVFDSYSVLAEENINPELLAIDMVGNPSDRDLIDKTAPKNLQISYSNESSKITDEGHVIVLDSISPECDIEYEEPKYEIDGKLYYNKAVHFLLKVKEANFFAEDFKLDMGKDGEKIDKNLIWNNVGTEEHVANLLLDEDGEYKLTANYTDKSKNKAETHSLNVVIDKTAPVLDIAFDQKTQSTIFTIKEQNFVPENILLRLSAKDISGNEIDTKELEEELTNNLRSGKWKRDGDTHEFTMSDYIDGIYSLKLLCKDLLYNESELCVVFNIQKMTN